MDAFFASVEQLRDPALRGKPVCVGGIPGQDRSVVASASYEARPYGIHAGMPVGQAQRLCPHAIFVRARGGVYLEISKRVVAILNDISDRVEPSSIDEAYVDITGVLKYWGGTEAIGMGLKERVKRELHLTCSVGIAPTRTLAKMGSDLRKPDGLTIITPDDVERLIFPLPVQKVPGIGPSFQEALNALGITTIRQLAEADPQALFKRFGVNGPHLQDVVRGKLNWEVVPEGEGPGEKSVGNSRTFSQDSDDPEQLKIYLLTIVQMVARRLREADLAGRTLTLTIRYGDFHTVTHRKSFSLATNDENDLFRVAWGLFEENYLLGSPVRLLGVSVSRLSARSARQTDLFDKESKLYPVLDALRDKFGEDVIRRSSTLEVHFRKPKDNIHFSKPLTNEQRRRHD